MKTCTVILAILAIFAGNARAESTIFKCVKADGSTVFLPTPCGKGAQEIGVAK